jgi:hypothetical protein
LFTPTPPPPIQPPAAWRLVPGYFLFICAGALLEIGWVMVWTLSYHLTHGNDFTYNYLTGYDVIWRRLYDLLVLADALVPNIEPPPTLDILVNSLVVAFIVLAVGYLAAVILMDRGPAPVRGALWIILAFGVIYQITLFIMPGVFTTDIFSYVMYGHISAIYQLNPYIYPPAYFPGNEMLDWIHPIWHNQTTVYGPLWTDIGWVMAKLTIELTSLEKVFAYKVLMSGVHLLNLALVWWLLGRMLQGAAARRARMTAFVVFAWNPLVLFDVVANAHNDGLMVTLLLLGLVPLTWTWKRISNGGWLVGFVCIGLSALVKYMTGLVGLFYLVPWARQLDSWRARVVWLGGACLVMLAITLVLFRPWLESKDVLTGIAGAADRSLFSNSVPDLVALTIADQVIAPGTADPDPTAPNPTHDAVREWFKWGARALFGVYLVWECVGLWRAQPAGPRATVEAILAASVRAFLILILVVLFWVLEWYFLWPLAMVTLLGWRRVLTKVTVGYTLTSLPIFYLHHYWSWHMSGGFVLLYALPPLLVPCVAWVMDHWPRGRADDRATAPSTAGAA